jgi:hypothetical protein
MTASGAPAHPRLRPPTYRTLVLIGVVVLLAALALAAGAALTPYILALIPCGREQVLAVSTLACAWP